MRKYIVLAAKRKGTDWLEVVAPEIADIVVSRKTFKAAAKSEGKQIFRKFLGRFSSNKSASRVIPTKSVKQTSRSWRVRFYTALINQVEYFLVLTFCGSFEKSCMENPSSWRCLVVPRTRNISHYLTPTKLKSVWFSNGSDFLHSFETDVFDF